MITIIFLGFILMLASPLHAETFSWVDDSGTYNYTEDYSKVPKKYRKKVKRRDDLPPDVSRQTSPAAGNGLRPAEKTDTKSAVVQGDGKEMYGGKSRAEWRREMDGMEAELSGIEQHMEQLRKQIYDANGISRIQFDVLKKEYDNSREAYDQKYKNYTELIEMVRKAGIVVEMKK